MLLAEHWLDKRWLEAASMKDVLIVTVELIKMTQRFLVG